MIVFSNLSSIINSQNSEWTMESNCKLQEHAGPQKPNNLKWNPYNRTDNSRKWGCWKRKTSIQRVENGMKKKTFC